LILILIVIPVGINYAKKERQENSNNSYEQNTLGLRRNVIAAAA